MTSELPYIVLVMINDEGAAGRIVVELDPLVEFNLAIDRQLAELESRMLAAMPQLRRGGGAERPLVPTTKLKFVGNVRLCGRSTPGTCRRSAEPCPGSGGHPR